MRNRSERKNNVFLKILPAVIAGIFLTCSCSDNKPDHKDLIPEKTLVAIVADAYIADGLLLLPKIRSEYHLRDSIENYIDIIEGYGYSKEAMDRTMKYYFIRNPKRLIRIYDQALDRLSKLESRINEEAADAPIVQNLWPWKSSYFLPDPAGNESMHFNLGLNMYGTYTLTFTATLYPSDQSFNPQFTAYLCHPDSIETGKRVYLPAIYYFKDGQPHTYTVVTETPDNSVVNLRGCFYDYENYHNTWEKNVRIENISFSFIPKPL